MGPPVGARAALERIVAQHAELARAYSVLLTEASCQIFQALQEENNALRDELSKLKPPHGGGASPLKGARAAEKVPPPPEFFPGVLQLDVLDKQSAVAPPRHPKLVEQGTRSIESLAFRPAGDKGAAPSQTTWWPPHPSSLHNMSPSDSQFSTEGEEMPDTMTTGEESHSVCPLGVSPDTSELGKAVGINPSRKTAVAISLEKMRSAERRRVRYVLNLEPGATVAHAQDVVNAMKHRGDAGDMTLAGATVKMKQLQTAHAQLALASFRGDAATQEGTVDIDLVVDLLIAAEDQTVLDHIARFPGGLALLQLFQMVTIDEVVECAALVGAARKPAVDRTQKPVKVWEAALQTLVTVVVVTNVLSMGISVDYAPMHIGWLLLEAFCTCVFVVEFIVKVTMSGPRDYFAGRQCHWNVCDFIVTMISCIDLVFSILLQLASDDYDLANVSGAVRVALVGRTLRIVRLLRLVKLVNSPLLRDLANMLVGFVIGVPSLFWVLVVFGVLLYVFGLVFRMSFGPYQGQRLLDLCGSPDGFDSIVNDVDGTRCALHLLYGEEFFGTVSKSMFTAFRFMLGDYSTRSGKSMIVAFSQGYGMRFDFAFVCWMIIVIFGYFNIITAIFVESTTAGLKHNDFKRKYAQQYERKYVMGKLKALMNRISHLHAERGHAYDRRSCMLGDTGSTQASDVSKVVIEEIEFVDIMEDDIVKELMVELDVSIFNPSGLFDTLDPEGTGFVTLPSMVQSIMKLRGEPQKNDIIASWVSLRALHSKFDTMQNRIECLQTQVNS